LADFQRGLQWIYRPHRLSSQPNIQVADRQIQREQNLYKERGETMHVSKRILVPCRIVRSVLAGCIVFLGCGSRTFDDFASNDATNHDSQTPIAIVDAHVPDPGVKPQGLDILFVIDNSPSMLLEQENIIKNMHRLFDANQLVSVLPDLRIGVIGPDLGAGNYGLQSCEVAGGDGGRLQNAPRTPGCIPPKDSWISYQDGVTNIPSNTLDPIQQVFEAFSCIAPLGADGCGFEHTLEAARRGLDPQRGINKGFIRPEAALLIVFVTDEDDCSASKPTLFDPNNESLGPPTSFRCFDYGVHCDINDRTKIGPRKDCKPLMSKYLTPVEEYINFFKGLKPAGWIILSAMAGPTDLIEVGASDGEPKLEHSCKTADGGGDPAIRLRAVVEAFKDNGFFNPGNVDICSADFGPALAVIGKRLWEILP